MLIKQNSGNLKHEYNNNVDSCDDNFFKLIFFLLHQKQKQNKKSCSLIKTNLTTFEF